MGMYQEQSNIGTMERCFESYGEIYEKCVGNFRDGQALLSSDKVGPRYTAVLMQPIRGLL